MVRLVWPILCVFCLLFCSSCGTVATPTEQSGVTLEENQAMFPPAPTDISITTENRTVLISWQAADPASSEHFYSDTILYYKVFRRTADELSPTLLGEALDLQYSDTSAEEGIAYYYSIVAVHAGLDGGEINGERSPEVSTTIEARTNATNEPQTMPGLTFEENRSMFPPFPADLSVSIKSDGVLLTWQTAEPVQTEHFYSDAVLYYKVFRRIDEQLTPTFIAETSELNYLDTTVSKGLTYYFSVVAIHAGLDNGEISGERSPEVSISIQ